MRMIKKIVFTSVTVACLMSVLYAREDGKSETSPVKSGVATAATVGGFGLASLGAVALINGINAAKITSNMGIVSSVQSIASSTSPYAALLVPGLILAIGAPVYLYRSAQSAAAKRKSLLGSAATIAGSALLLAGLSALDIISYIDKPLGIAEKCLSCVGFQKTAESMKLYENAGFLISIATLIAGFAGALAGYALQP